MGSRQFVRIAAMPSVLLSLTSISLTTKLPFEDDEFDHVHIRSIARAVPESKVRDQALVNLRDLLIRLQWDYLFEVRASSRFLQPIP